MILLKFPTSVKSSFVVTEFDFNFVNKKRNFFGDKKFLARPIDISLLMMTSQKM